MTVVDAALLLGPHAADLLGAAVAPHGGRLAGVRPVHANVLPSGDVVVQYRGEVIRADGGHGSELLVAATGAEIPDGATVLRTDAAAEPVGVWRWPQDPALPGLALVAHPARAARLLWQHGLCTASTVDLSVRAYRPGRRAVVELRSGHARWFVKVVRPGGVAELCARHDLLHRHGLPVPPVLAAADSGAVVLPAVPGRPLRELITADEAPPAPAELERVLDALPAELADRPARRTCLQRVADSATVLRRTAGAATGPAVDDLVDRLTGIENRCPATIPVHGDFYEAQLFADAGRVTGLLDVDTAGAGERADEWATLLGHLAVAAAVDPAVRRYCDTVAAYAERRIGRRTLRPRTAAVLLGLATGPFRRQRPDWLPQTVRRVTLAREWLLAT